MIETAPTPLSLYANYLEAVREALQQQPSEWTFKSDWRYREVLEHVTADQAEAFLRWSLHEMPGLDLRFVRELCEYNDRLGQPVRQAIPGLGTHSPSNMRYLCHAIKVWQHIDALGLSEVRIVELGGGYGGLAFYVHVLQHLFKAQLKAYDIIDLPEVAGLQWLVLSQLGVPVRTLHDTTASGASDFCISAYAFSEFDQPTRDWYADRLLKHCRHGLMIWNFPEPVQGSDGRWFGGQPYQFVEWPISCTPDKPNLYLGHQLVRW